MLILTIVFFCSQIEKLKKRSEKVKAFQMKVEENERKVGRKKLQKQQAALIKRQKREHELMAKKRKPTPKPTTKKKVRKNKVKV